MKPEILLLSPVAIAIYVLFALAAASFLWGYITKRDSDQPERRLISRFQTLPLMVYVASGCSAVFLIFYAAAFQEWTFYTPPGAVGTPGAPSSVLRVAPITIAASLFGGALFIAFTVLKYRSHTQAEEKLDLEKTDAVFRTAEHYTERFSKAAEMLGSERAATRLGGVYALAALADEWSLNRQQCIDLLCGYMRSPVSSVSTESRVLRSPQLPSRELMKRPEMEPDRIIESPDEYRAPQRAIATRYEKLASRDEVEVRKAILASIARGTRRRESASDSWSGMVFDLGGCFIESIDFSHCTFRKKVNFNGSIFLGSTNMRKVAFMANAQFDGCLFMDRTWFSKAIFGGHAWFRAAEFNKEARFGGAQFLGGMIFSYSKFNDLCYFHQNRLGGAVSHAKEIPYADWTGATLPSGQSACLGIENPSIWDEFTSIDSDYGIRCEMGHAHGSSECASSPKVPS